jgi:aryl-alcohol dehydrogenase-like predicted oxidoreductase
MEGRHTMRRRDFLRQFAGVGGGLLVGGLAGCSIGREDQPKSAHSERDPNLLPIRPFGDKDLSLSVVGLGGITLNDLPERECDRLVRQALDKGVNWVDSSPRYGNSEPRLGRAIEPVRERLFVACKTQKRTYAEAKQQLDASLERLRTDRIDLYQLHALKDMHSDVDVAFGNNGALKLLIEARKAGKVRFLGFSAHSVPAAMAAMERFEFDSVMFPVNFGCWIQGNFGPQVVAEARKRNLAVLALKTLCKQRWKKWDNPRRKQIGLWYEPLTDPDEADLAFRFTLSQPISAMLPPGKPEFLTRAIQLGLSYRPLPPRGPDVQKLHRLAGDVEPMFTHRGENLASADMRTPGYTG